MLQAQKLSFTVILSLIFLAPLFFIPGGTLYLDSAKSALFVFALAASALIFIYSAFKEGGIKFPKHFFLLAAFVIPLIYLLSALLTTPTSMSLFGYSFEVGTFGFLLIGSVLLVLASIVFSDNSRQLTALVALFLSLSLVAIFTTVKILSGGDILVWGNFFGNMGNPIGGWTDLAISFGLLSLLAALIVGMIPMRHLVKILMYAVFVLSIFLLVVINFFTAFIFTLALSILLFFYFQKIESHYFFSSPEESRKRNFFSRPTFLPLVLAVISLAFLINPTISDTKGALGSIVSGAFGINNTEVSPSFSATLDISKAVLSRGALLGSGPNTFSQDWLIYKPAEINKTPFWGVAFPFGAGFIPTQIASTGILGTILWLVFFALFIHLAFKAVSYTPESRAERFIILSTLLVSLFLWSASFLYAPSATILVLAFIFSGVFIASLAQAGIINSRAMDFRSSPTNRFISSALLIAVALGALYMGWIGFEKTVSAYHWKKAVDLSNVPGTLLVDIEKELIYAADKSPADVYYVALSRLNFGKAQVAAVATTSPEQNRAVFEESLGRSIEAAKLAVNVNPAGYQNWVALGTVYSALVPKPLAIEGAYENAQFAYNEALKRNPSNPELYLMLAQLELNKEDTEKARSFVRNAIALKEDYADAYLMLAQIEVSAGNAQEAIASAERLAVLVPNNPGLHLELGIMKYSVGDYAGAERAINRSLLLAPEYANAKYYLGLTLIQLNRLAEAQAEFEDLSRTNPDNPEVIKILEPLREGKKPAITRP